MRATARAIAIIGCGLLAIRSATHMFQMDEIEHLHSAWLIASGLRPYTDFFQHHHRLMWDIFAVLMPLTPESAWSVLLYRFLMLCQLAGVMILTFRFARNAADSSTAAWLAVALLATMSAFGQHAYLIRPDLPEALCVLAAAFVLDAAGGRRTIRVGVGSGLLFGLAFLFSMKAAVVLAIDGAMVVAWWLRGRVTARFVATFAAACAAPFAVYVLQMAVSGVWRDYYLANWPMNVAVIAITREAGFEPGQALFFNGAFWLLGLCSAIWAIVRRGGMQRLEIAALNGLGIIALLVVMGRTESRSVLVAIPFLAITGAAGFERLVTRTRGVRLSGAAGAIVLAAICAPPIYHLARGLPATHREQRQLIDFVLAQVPPGEPVYDGNNEFNIFRPDLHYFWFHFTSLTSPAENRAQAAAILHHSSYDECELVRSRRPRVLSTTTIDLAACGLEKEYEATPYPRLRVRRDQSSPSGSNFSATPFMQ